MAIFNSYVKLPEGNLKSEELDKLMFSSELVKRGNWKYPPWLWWIAMFWFIHIPDVCTLHLSLVVWFLCSVCPLCNIYLFVRLSLRSVCNRTLGCVWKLGIPQWPFQSLLYYRIIMTSAFRGTPCSFKHTHFSWKSHANPKRWKHGPPLSHLVFRWCLQALMAGWQTNRKAISEREVHCVSDCKSVCVKEMYNVYTYIYISI